MSKGLKALERIKATLIVCKKLYLNESAVAEIEKELKALEIIKNKLIDVGRLYGCMVAYPNEKTPIHYNEKIDKRYKTYMLTQEEYDLLKEVLLCH